MWDTGHRAYVHKMLTGRAGQFGTLRTEGGLSGYPSRAESEHDWVENSHASTSLSYADGMAKANLLLGKDDHVVAVIGDGALTGGMAWEALNNIAADNDRRLVVVVNDNGRPYTPTVGGLANRLTEIRTNPRYEPALGAIKERLNRSRIVGPRIRSPARDQEGRQGRTGAAGHVRGPRPQVHRPRPRPRPARRRARPDTGQEVRRSRARPRVDDQGPGL